MWNFWSTITWLICQIRAVTEWQLVILQQLTLPLTIGCRQVFKKRELIIYKQIQKSISQTTELVWECHYRECMACTFK